MAVPSLTANLQPAHPSEKTSSQIIAFFKSHSCHLPLLTLKIGQKDESVSLHN